MWDYRKIGDGAYIAVVKHENAYWLGAGESGLQAIYDAHPQATSAKLYYVSGEYFGKAALHESGNLVFEYNLEHFGIAQPDDKFREKLEREAYLGEINIPKRVDTEQ